MTDEQIFRFVSLVALLLFLMPLVLRRGRRGWHMAALGAFGIALLFALYRITVWLAG
jgi:hypothetical protein